MSLEFWAKVDETLEKSLSWSTYLCTEPLSLTGYLGMKYGNIIGTGYGMDTACGTDKFVPKWLNRLVQLGAIAWLG